MNKLNLKQAIESNRVEDFIKQNQDEVGDKDRFDSVLRSTINSSKATRQTSSEEPSEN
jgi:hypothetical protein